MSDSEDKTVAVLRDAALASASFAPPDDTLDGFILIAYWSRFDKWWKVFKDIYPSHEAAKNAAKTLPPGYTHRVIFHVTYSESGEPTTTLAALTDDATPTTPS
jgi:hypothetical protein